MPYALGDAVEPFTLRVALVQVNANDEQRYLHDALRRALRPRSAPTS